MKLKTTFLILLFFITLYTKAQTYVTIPDAQFAAWLDSHYPTCMNGNQMDTTCSDIKNAIQIYIPPQNIADLTGLEYFIHLQFLTCDGNLLTSLPPLPVSMIDLSCNQNHLTSLPALPYTIKELWCNHNQLTSLPVLPDSLKRLLCDYNQLTSLPAIPNKVYEIYCGNNLLTSIPQLPNSLLHFRCQNNLLQNLPLLPNSIYKLLCYHNLLTSLPGLPNSLKELQTNNNLLTSLPGLPGNIDYINCDSNQLTSIPTMPHSLRYFYCNKNLLINLPVLPDSMNILDCSYNQLTSLPVLPVFVGMINCSHNQLTSLPALPNKLSELYCGHNQLYNIPAIPDSLGELDCSYNQLTGLPILTNLLHWLHCNNNNITCFPVFPNSFYYNSSFDIDSNSFTCLPNYISTMDSATLAYPLCIQGDLVNNPNGCPEFNYISGHIYKDSNANCLRDTVDLGLANIPLKLYDNNNNVLVQMNSLAGGDYNFLQQLGIYKVAIDTAGMPFMVQCPHPGADSTINTTTGNHIAADINFALTCKPGFDIGVQSVVTSGAVSPGRNHILKFIIGNMSQWYNLICGSGVSGQVVISVTGPLTYLSPAIGALTPLVNGNIFTYNIADFDNINIMQDFSLQFKTNTTAQSGDTICVNVTVTPTSGDINDSNNSYHYCYHVTNSHDPNSKEVYPESVLPGYDGYFTYTIHFQNTGSAPAYNIFLIDTLSNNLDLATFKVINYSHNNIASLTGNVLTFRFPNIMLPDSTTDEPGSNGFVQYKIKPKGALTAGTEIKNTAYIYFDYNAPVVTNTTVNEYIEITSIPEGNALSQISVYPNPVLDYATVLFTISKPQHIEIKVHDLLGQEMLLLNQDVNSGTNSIQLNTRTLAKGVYIISIKESDNEVKMVKFVK